MIIELPWPPADLSGHNTGNHYTKGAIVKKHRQLAYMVTKALRIEVPAKGDIPVSVTFHAPDNRSDRINYWNRCKPYFDGIAEAMGVNDARFLPAGYHVGDNVTGGKVVIAL